MRIGFIGGAGHHYLRQLISDPPATLSELRVAAAGDGYDDARASTFATSLTGAKWYDDAAAMLDDFQPNIVSVGAVYGHIGEVVAMCIGRGLPVVTDKPLAATWQQYHRIATIAQANAGTRIATEFDLRSAPAFVAARLAVQRGMVGDVALVAAQKSYRFGDARPAFYKSRSDYGGTLLWIASHGIDAIAFTTGLRFASVRGAHGNVTQPTYGSMEDHTVSMFELSNGGHAVAHADFLRPGKAHTHGDDRIRIAGSRGVVEVRDGRCMLTTHDAAEHEITGWAQPTPVHHALLAAVTGTDDTPYSTAESLRMARILLHARDAADKGMTIAMADD
jgi:predicted dehydrogenase